MPQYHASQGMDRLVALQKKYLIEKQIETISKIDFVVAGFLISAIICVDMSIYSFIRAMI